jgi:thymidine kinase
MFSKKTAAMLDSIEKQEYAERRVVIFKPEADTRTGAWVESRDGSRHHAVIVKTASEMLPHAEHADVIGIEEAQFFDYTVVSVIESFVAHGKVVYVAGLDTDCHGNPYGAMPQLMAIAQEVQKRYAVCTARMADKRVCGGRAVRSQLLAAVPHHDTQNPPVIIDDGQNYAPRCLDHFLPPLVHKP